jgi:hypothetical protein
MLGQQKKIDELFDSMALEVLSYIREVEESYSDCWVPAAFLKSELNLKKDSYPRKNEIQNKTGWLFAALARRLEDLGKVEFKKEGSRSYYRTV